jgi:HEAT repeat protein
MQWSDAWVKSHNTQPPDDQTMHLLSVDNQGRSVLEVTLKMWTALAADAQEAGRAGWYDALVRRRLPDPETLEAAAVLAARIMEAGQPVYRAALQESLVQAAANAGDGKKVIKPEGLIDALLKAGLLVAYAGDKMSFPHVQLTNYLASRTLTESERAVELAQAPAWQEAIGFAAGHINLLPIIVRKLGTVPDLLYSDLFDLVRWLPDAPPDAPWRGDLFKRLAAALMAPDQYPAVRERAAAALVASRDKNVFFVLRQALRATDPDIRRLGCIGLGALGNPEAVNDLAALLADENPGVKLSAALSLGALGTPKALEVMIHGLFQEGPEIQRAIAEALAAVPGEGHQILRDAIVAQEIELRRAAVYGLSRVPASWSLIALYRAMLEDEQWYVRTAAEEAFLAAQSPEKDGPRHHPEADALGWLVKWAADRGEGVPAGANARQVLVRVLQEGLPVYKIMAAATLARLGHITALKPLYGALRDRDAGVRSAAYRALFDLQIRLGQPLPGLL